MTRKSKTIPLAAHRAQRTRVTLESAARELNENLASLQTLLKQLLDEANEKLAAMRAADTERMQRCTGREADLLEQVARVEEQRTAIVACLAQRMPDQMPRGPSLREISQALPEPVSSVFKAKSVALRDVAAQLQEKNQLVARVAHGLQSHLRSVFADVAKAHCETVGYGPRGQHEQVHTRSLLDAVG